MQKATTNLKTFTCPPSIQKIENALKGLNGTEKDSVEVERRELIVRAVVEQCAEQVMQRLEKAIARAETPLAVLETMCMAHIGFITDRPGVPRLMLGQLKHAEMT